MTVSILLGGLFFSLVSPPHKEHHHHHAKPEKQVMQDDEHHEMVAIVEADSSGANLILLALTTIDFFIRSYMTVCVYSIYVKFKSERIESEFMNGSDKQRLSYGSGTGSMDKMTDNCSIINER